MNKRQFLGALGAASAALALTRTASADGLEPCPGPGPDTLSAAGTLLLLATAEHGADGLRQAIAALAMQASGGCSGK